MAFTRPSDSEIEDLLITAARLRSALEEAGMPRSAENLDRALDPFNFEPDPTLGIEIAGDFRLEIEAAKHRPAE